MVVLDCTAVIVTCSLPGLEGTCLLQYTPQKNYQHFSQSLSVALNTPTQLPQSDSFTEYSIQSRVIVNSGEFVLRKNFTTESGMHYF